MATSSQRPFAFNKKYDDKSRKDTPNRTSLRAPFSLRKRRIFLGLLVAGLVYLFINFLPTDVTPVGDRVDPRYGRLRPDPPTRHHDPLPSVPQEQQYDGPIRFFNLGRTLRGSELDGKNDILFVFSSPESASAVVTAACAMSQHNRTAVHLANVGRREMAFTDLLKLNGISPADCHLQFHEAQPDFPIQSSERRMRVSCEAAIGHINRAQPLHAIFIDHSSREDEFVSDAIRYGSGTVFVPVLQVPTADSWMLTLDTHSLRLWNQLQVEILIQAPRESSGSLLRLLRNIRDADYRGLPSPRVTLELPTNVDPFITDFLNGFHWPPGASAAESKLTVRHRVDSKVSSSAMASSRFIESFYPTRSGSTHVLVLSSNVELSSQYYQYVMYMLMEYRYGGRMNLVSSKLMGISLVDASAKLKTAKSSPPTLLWQLPNADATLFFGDKWVELHDFAARRLAADPELSRTVDAKNTLAAREPAWLGLVSELLHLTGTFVVYPRSNGGSSPFATLHTELRQVPEESTIQEADGKGLDNKSLKLGEEADVLTAQDLRVATDWEQNLSTPSLTEVMSSLKGQGDISNVDEIALAAYDVDGEVVTWRAVRKAAEEYADQFSQVVGRCPPMKKSDDTDDLFCE